MDERHPVRVVGAVLLAVALIAACGPRAPRPQSRPLGGMVVACEPADAMLFVDDKYLGTTGGLKGRPMQLPEGVHRIELRKDGYFAHLAEITIARGVQQKLAVKLRKQPF